MNRRLFPKKLKRVKWFPDAKLCQVKLFLSEDSPSKINGRAEDHLQAKTASILKSHIDDPPPGCGGMEFSETLKITCVPQTAWKCPPLFILNDDWHVVAGELSEEIETQKCRELRVLEAVYPRPSNIPPSPSVLPCLGEFDYDDRETVVIPVIPIEEEDAVDHESTQCSIPKCFNTVATNQDQIGKRLARHNAPRELNVTINKKSDERSSGLEADVFAAAKAAFTAIMKSNEKGSLIDTDLLVKILKDPQMIEQLLKEKGVSGTTKLTPSYATSLMPIPTKECHSIMAQKPLDRGFNMHDAVQKNVQLASNGLSSSEGAQADENLHQFCEDLQFSSNTSVSVSTAITSSTLQDINKLLQVMLSTPTTLSSSWSKTAIIPSTIHTSLLDKIESTRQSDRLELLDMVPTISSAHILGSNETASQFVPQPDNYLLQNRASMELGSTIHSLQTTMSASKSTSTTSMSNQESLIALSSRPGHLSENYRPNMISSTAKRIQNLPRKTSPARCTLQYSSSSSDELVGSPVSSINTPAVKDSNYYRSLIKLHGTEGQSNQEYTQQYRSRKFNLTEVSRQGVAREKIKKRCKFFNSSHGCRNGISCLFMHDSSIKLRAGSKADTFNSKRIKLGREIT